MRLALIDPNENSLAQVEWCGRDYFANISRHHTEVQSPFEANTWHHYFKKEFKHSLIYCKQWANFQPLSSGPIIQASYIALTCLNKSDEAIKMFNDAPPIVQTNFVVKNNYIVALLSQNRVKDAFAIFNSIKHNDCSNIDKLTYTATMGMFYYRSNQPEIGASSYMNAIDGFDVMAEHGMAAVAAYYFAAEEKRIGSNKVKSRINDAKKRVKRYGVFTLDDRIKQL